MSRPAVFLDRDGVINDVIHDGNSVRSPRVRDEFVLVSGAHAQIRRLSRAGFICVVVTNQPDVVRERLSVEDADWFTSRLKNELGIHAVYECRHDDIDGCRCRKPQPGMLLDAANDLDLDLRRSWLIGDRWVDIAAASAAGVRSILLDRAWSWLPGSSGGPVEMTQPIARVAELVAAVDIVIADSPGHLG